MKKSNLRVLFISIILIFCIFKQAVAASTYSPLKLGIDVLMEENQDLIKGKKVGMLIAPSSLNSEFEHTIDVIAKIANIKAVFTGEKYFRSLTEDASKTKKIDVLTEARVYEIIDPLKRPTIEELDMCEIIIIDVQDIGIRYFNYVTILAQFLELARDIDLPVILLDRPNPINGLLVAGPMLDESLRSRFGVYPIPLVHGMTYGELALYFNKVFGLGAKLTVIGMEGYSREMTYSDTGLHWVPPSDHLSEPDYPSYYAITGFLGEMGVFSTGVGTTRPFHYVLAPWMDGELIAHNLDKYNLKGIRFRAVSTKPYYGLYERKQVSGIEIIILDSLAYDPVITGVAILQVLFRLYPDRIPLDNTSLAQNMDILLGVSYIRESILKKAQINAIISEWNIKLAGFLDRRKNFLIYRD
ncbi:MAG: DUF1343 domain-containing protein [Candidatus Riflebacteria bacterium]|nr:DUF1343 domain-containing protein [Candidatus Riflebacteria bacterium]